MTCNTYLDCVELQIPLLCFQDVSTRYAGALFGITNAGASLGGMVFVSLVGVILDRTRSWSLVFQLVSLLNFSSAAVYGIFASSEPQFE